MSTITPVENPLGAAAGPAAAVRAPRRMTARGFRALAGMHVKLLIREPRILVWLLIPVVLTVIFGEIPAFQKPQPTLPYGRSVLDAYVPVFAAMEPLFLACAILPAVMATFRERNTLKRFAVSPVSPAGMLAALVAVVAAAMAVAVAVILGVAALAFHLAVPPNLGAVISSFLFGAAAVLALGLFITALAPTTGAATAAGVPLMILNFFFAGLYFPLYEFPRALRDVANFVPFGAVMDSWYGYGMLWQHLAVLAGYAVLAGAAAAKWFRWS